MAKVLNGIETVPKISMAWVGSTNVTDDRQTDRGQTDGRTTIYSEREREFTFAKNHWVPVLDGFTRQTKIIENRYSMIFVCRLDYRYATHENHRVPVLDDFARLVLRFEMRAVKEEWCRRSIPNFTFLTPLIVKLGEEWENVIYTDRYIPNAIPYYRTSVIHLIGGCCAM